jgi:hypothetical protein
MRSAPEEIRVPEIGLLQWWSDSPWDRQHWYVGEDRRAYRVAVEDGRAGSICDAGGSPITDRLSEPENRQEALL